MANANIFAQFARPVRSIAEYQDDAMQREAGALNLEGARRKNAMDAMTMQQGQEKRNAIQSILAGLPVNASDQQRIAAFRSNPNTLGEADALEKSVLERQKVGAEVMDKTVAAREKLLNLGKSAAGMVAANPTPEALEAVIAAYEADAEQITGKRDNTTRALFQGATTPEQIRERAMRISLALDKQLPKTGTENLGGTMAYTSVDPINGMVTTNRTADITQSADNAATQATSVENNKRTVGATIRGQDMTDGRAREGSWSLNSDGVLVNSRSGETRAATGAGGKPVGSPKLTEIQGKATGFASRMEDAEKTLNKFEGKVWPSQVAMSGYKSQMPNWLPGGQIIGGALTAANKSFNPMVTEDAMGYQQAQENWVTANLRLESGAVIGPEEMQKEIQKYFPQPGEPKSIADQKKKARAVAQRAVKAQAGPGQNMIKGIVGQDAPQGTWEGGDADPLGLRR